MRVYSKDTVMHV